MFVISVVVLEVMLEISLADDVMDMEEVVVVGFFVIIKCKQFGNVVNVLKFDKFIVVNLQGVMGVLQGKFLGVCIM